MINVKMKKKKNKKHLKNVGPIRHCEPLHAYSAGVATSTVARRLRIDVHDDANNDNDNAWQTGPLWPHGMGPTMTHAHEKKGNGTEMEKEGNGGHERGGQ